MINRQFLFARVRLDLFSGSLKQSQVTGIDGILDEWESGTACVRGIGRPRAQGGQK